MFHSAIHISLYRIALANNINNLKIKWYLTSWKNSNFFSQIKKQTHLKPKKRTLTKKFHVQNNNHFLFKSNHTILRKCRAQQKTFSIIYQYARNNNQIFHKSNHTVSMSPIPTLGVNKRASIQLLICIYTNTNTHSHIPP